MENTTNLHEFTPVDKETFIQRLERKSDQFVIWSRELSSRGTSFLIAMLGVVLQASHTTLLMYSVSGFESNALKFIVALGLGVFISSALAIFTIKFDGENDSIRKIILVFFYFEIFSNLFYYFNSLIFAFVTDDFGFNEIPPKNWLYLIICMPFAYIVPFTIKQFSGMITADQKLKFGSIDNPFESEQQNVQSTVDVETLKQSFKELDGELYQQKMSIENIKDRVNDLDRTALKQGQTIKLPVDGKDTIITLQTPNK